MMMTVGIDGEILANGNTIARPFFSFFLSPLLSFFLFSFFFPPLIFFLSIFDFLFPCHIRLFNRFQDVSHAGLINQT